MQSLVIGYPNPIRRKVFSKNLKITLLVKTPFDRRSMEDGRSGQWAPDLKYFTTLEGLL